MISFVWAEDKNHIIGEKGHLPWSLPNDLHHFKDVTVNHPIVMGRKTFESFPNGPLPKRLNIVISKNPDYQVPDSVILINDKADLKKYIQPDDEVMVIGGSGIFKLFKLSKLIVGITAPTVILDSSCIPVSLSNNAFI